MFGINDPERQKTAIFVLLIAGGGVLFYLYLWSPLHTERVAMEEHLGRLESGNEAARVVTQPRRVNELRQREAEYEVALAAYETMLPSEAEVPGLLEEVSAAALLGEVDIVRFAPMEAIRGQDLVEFPYDLQVQGRYHDIGLFLAELVNLPRLVRPAVVALEAVEVNPATETLDAEYEVLATFVLSTFVPAGASVTPAKTEGESARAAPGPSERQASSRQVERGDAG